MTRSEDPASWILPDSPDCFRELYPEELKQIDEKRTQLVYRKGENLLKQGAFATHVIYVIDGLIKLSLQTGAQRQISIRLAKRGDFLAFPVLFGDKVYGYSAVAVKDSTVSMIDKDALLALLRENVNFAMRITTRNLQYESYLLEIIKNVSYKQMRGKLASALLYLSQSGFLEEGVFQHLTRQDIGEFASISAESTIRFLKEFEKEGILSLNGKDVTILKEKVLEEISLKG